MKRFAFAAVLALVTSSGLATADTPPSAWDRARDPAAGERYRLHERVQAWLNAPGIRGEREHALFAESARSALEAASAQTSPDVRLRFDLGIVYEDLDRHDEALAVLRPALDLAPRDAAAAPAWLAYAFAAAKTDRSREEIEGYDALIALSFEARPTVLANRAEAEMRLGNLDAAVSGYRDVIFGLEHAPGGRASDAQSLVLARWGLAVALDRLGDTTTSRSEALTAAREDPQEKYIGDRNDVFFVPDYERDWYYGVGRAERARLETDARLAVEAWDLVVRTWADYVARAVPSDRWLPLARAHLASAESERQIASARLPATRRAPRPASGARSGAH